MMIGLTTSLLLFSRIIYNATSFHSCKRFSEIAKIAERSGIKYRIRPATPDDIPKIHQCNLINLPEHYNSVFYLHHLTRWPELSLIAETEESDLMGYALGRIETRPENNLPFMPPSPPHYFGHVASVAVHEYYRGNGVGKGLIEKLHEEFGTTFQLDEASLYCRASNVAAMNMYSKLFHYQCDHIIPKYYDDNEDAHLMFVKGLRHRYNKLSSTSAMDSSNKLLQ